MKSKKSIQIIGILFFISFISNVFIHQTNAQQILPSSPYFFSPVGMIDLNYKIFGTGLDQGKLLYEWNGSETPQITFDSDHKYPGISVLASDPYICNFDGSSIALTSIDEENQILNVNGIQGYSFNSEDSTFSFIQTLTMAQDILVRSHANFKPEYFNYYSDTLIDVEEYGYPIVTIAKDFDINNIMDYMLYPWGVLAGGVATPGLLSWDTDVSWSVTGGVFDKALFPNHLYWQKGDTYGTSDDNPDFDETDWLLNNYGCSQVQVETEAIVRADDLALTFDYAFNVDDGTIQLKPLTSQVGIFNIRQSSFQDYGFVESQEEFQLAIDKQNPIQVFGETTDELDDFGLPPTNFVDQSSQIRSVYFRYKANSNWTEPLTPNYNFIFPSTYLDKNITKGQITPEDFDYLNEPKIGYHKTNVLIQPFVNVKYCQFEEQGFYEYYYAVTGATRFSGYPYKAHSIAYGLKLTNTYALYRVLIDVVIVSQQEVLFVPFDGSPIDVTDISDFGISEFGLLPTWYNVGGYVTEREGLFGEEFTQWFWSIVIVVIVIIVLIITYQIVKNRARIKVTTGPGTKQQIPRSIKGKGKIKKK